MKELRDYQAEAVEELRERIRRGYKRILLCMATGAGKTITSLAMIRSAVDMGRRADFVVDRLTLLNQTRQVLHEEGIGHDVLQGENTRLIGMPVRVCSAQTIQRRIADGRYDAPHFCILDEVHEIRPSVMTALTEAGVICIGLTATPFPSRLQEYWQTMVNAVTTEALIAQGHLCPFDVLAPTVVVDTAGVSARAGEFNQAELSKRTMRIVGDVVPTWERQVAQRYGGAVPPTIAFGVDVTDALRLETAFREAGYEARTVSYKQSNEANASVIRAYARGDFPVIVNASMLSRGFDVPMSTILIDCYPMRKMLTPVQRYGRIMRTADAKTRGLVIDHAENWRYMGGAIKEFYGSGPSWPPDGKYDGASRKEKDPTVAVCRECGQVVDRDESACLWCGLERPPPRLDGGAGRALERVDGVLRLVDTINGISITADKDELWREVCTHAASVKQDRAAALRMARAIYRDCMGEWPAWGSPLRPHKGRACDPAVKELIDRNHRAWRARNRPRKTA